MYQLIKSIELEPRNKNEGYIYFFDDSLKTDDIDFLKIFKKGTDNKILRFNRNFQIFKSFGIKTDPIYPAPPVIKIFNIE